METTGGKSLGFLGLVSAVELETKAILWFAKISQSRRRPEGPSWGLLYDYEPSDGPFSGSSPQSYIPVLAAQHVPGYKQRIQK